MKKEQYYLVLQRHAIPSDLWITEKKFAFQQNNDPKHSSKLCQNYHESKKKKKRKKKRGTFKK